MPDREKVILGLECCLSGQPEGLGCDRGCPYNELEDCEGALHYDALALLKAQEPVKPYFNSRLRWSCGNQCGTDLMGFEKYCPYCGRAVKWE